MAKYHWILLISGMKFSDICIVKFCSFLNDILNNIWTKQNDTTISFKGKWTKRNDIPYIVRYRRILVIIQATGQTTLTLVHKPSNPLCSRWRFSLLRWSAWSCSFGSSHGPHTPSSPSGSSSSRPRVSRPLWLSFPQSAASPVQPSTHSDTESGKIPSSA